MEFLGSTICCVIFGYIFKLDIPHMVLVGSVGSIVAQFGDLFASAIKRYVGIKDYGKLIPGHGGILDRFDSVILVAPFVYYAIYLFI
ncbi:phosphatidate cytidylyltransferase [Paraclostridium bifermentans]|nr:phosphatidate cytidylyltransferase [Paraclostridium bifermentans]